MVISADKGSGGTDSYLGVLLLSDTFLSKGQMGAATEDKEIILLLKKVLSWRFARQTAR